MTESLFQYLISLPLMVGGSVFTLGLVSWVFYQNLALITEEQFLWIGIVIFIGIFFGSFYLGDKIISKWEEKKKWKRI